MAKPPKKVEEEASKEDPIEPNRMELLQKIGFRTARQSLGAFKDRKCYYIQPLSLALTGRRDPTTGFPGIPSDAIIELAGMPGKGKSLTAEWLTISVLKDNPKNLVAWLCYENPDQERWDFLEKAGFDQDRIITLDYNTGAMLRAEDGLHIIRDLPYDFPEVRLVVIDSIGAMAVDKELRDPKTGKFKPVDKQQAFAARALTMKMFIDQWCTIPSSLRPILCLINHMIPQVDNDGFGVEQAAKKAMDPDKIGKDLNYVTSGGKKYKYRVDMSIRVDAKKWPETGEAETNAYSGQKFYNGLEIFYEIYRSRYFPGRHWARAIYDMTDRTNCHFLVEEELLEVAHALGICGISKGGNGRWTVDDSGKTFHMSQAVEKLKANPELCNQIIIEAAKPGNPERFHKNTKKDNKKAATDANEVL